MEHVAACLRGQFWELVEGVTSCLVSLAGTGPRVLGVILECCNDRSDARRLRQLKAGRMKGMGVSPEPAPSE